MSTSEEYGEKRVEDATEATVAPTVSRRRLAFKPAGRLPTLRSANQSQSSVAGKQGHSSIELRSRIAVTSDNPGTSRVEATPETIVRDEVSDLHDSQKKGKTWSHQEIMVYYEALKQVGKDFDSLVKLLNKKKVRKDKEQVKNFYFNFIKFMRSLIDFDDALFPGISRDARELFIVINSIEWRKKTGSSKYQVDRLKEMILDGSTTVRCKKKTMVFKTPACPALTKYFTRERYIEKLKFPSSIKVLLKPKTYTDAAALMASCQNPLLKITISLNDRIKRIFDVLKTKWLDSSLSLSNNTVSARSVRLYPDDSITVGKVVVTQSVNLDTSISLNRLKSECEQDGAMDKNPAFRVVTPSPFILSDDDMSSGLTLENIGDSTVLEMYCLCGMTREVTLTYSIEADRRNSWAAFCSLLDRDFGEAITASDIVDAKKKLNDDCYGKSSARRVKAPIKEQNPSIESDIIIRESAQCMNQVQRLRERRKRKHHNPEPISSTREAFLRKNSKRICNEQNVSYSVQAPSLPPATDFSQMSNTNYTFLSSLKTPEKQGQSSTSFYHDHRSKESYMESLFGKDMSASPDRTRSILLSPGMMREEDLFGSISVTPSKERTGLFTSLDGSSESFRGIVANTVSDMMNQNSNDFFKTFSPLVDAVSPAHKKSAQEMH